MRVLKSATQDSQTKLTTQLGEVSTYDRPAALPSLRLVDVNPTTLFGNLLNYNR